ncbi:hypothetical protein QYF61_000813 [Mycteria americana]|uniref:Uncharacterized protein n=1 Tax=Mycteria americana TaxID=33587 RepID=A0AAN7NSP0_MYCAM|nr:hypothetical protein QYF61_000813 [Mycteria americana]
MGPPRGHKSCQQTCSSVGSSLSMVYRFCQEPAPAWASHGVTASFRCIHLLWCGVLHGLQVDICSTMDLHGLQGDSLPHHGLNHWLQGNLCSGTWSTSSPSFFTDLGNISIMFSLVERKQAEHHPYVQKPMLKGKVFLLNVITRAEDVRWLRGYRKELKIERRLNDYIFYLIEGDLIIKGLIHITESQNRIGWKGPLRSSSPTVNLALPRPPLYHVPKHLIQTSFKYLQGWRLNHFPGQPVPMLDNPFSEVKFPHIQSKPPLVQLEAISSHPSTCYLGEETNTHLSTTSFQVVVESDKVSPQPPFLQAKQSQLPQPLLRRLLLQTLHQLRCPSLDTLQPLNVPLVVRGPKLNTVFEEDDHFPSPAGHTIPDTSQDAVGFLGHLGTLLAHIQAAVNQRSQVLLCWAAFQPLFPKPVALHGVVVTQVQDLALGLVEPHTIGPGPSIEPVQIPLPTVNPTPPCLLNHVPKCHVYMFLNSSRDGDSTTSLGSLFQCFTTLSSKPLLMQLEAISSCPIASYLGEETNTHLATTSFQVVVESKKVLPESPFLQTKQPQLPQPLLIRLVLQTLHQLH